MIALKGLRGRWGNFGLEVDLEVEAGRYLVVLGPSGSGKSLMLAVLAGLEPLLAGQVVIEGEDVTALPPERRGVGLVFQRFALFPHLGVAENIAFGLKVRRWEAERQRKRVEELVEVLGIAPLLDRPVTALSGGEAQKVAIARALAPRPRVLLLDEPLSLVDHHARVQLQKELRELHQTLEVTTVHVTHDRDEARALADDCVVMLGGRVVQRAPASELFEEPLCTFVQRFLALEGEPLAARDDCSAICLAGAGRCDRREAGEGG